MIWQAHRQAAAIVAQALKDAVPATEDYDVVRADYGDRLFEAFMGYASSGDRVTRFINAARRAVVEDVPGAFYSGYAEVGGEDTEPDDEEWLSAAMNTQLQFLPGAFAAIRDEREAETVTEDGIYARVGAWQSALDGIYSEGKLRGAKNVMLTFDGDDGEESCDECQTYKGERHSAAWWLRRDLVRRNGNDNFGCGRWEPCQHNLYTDKGEMYTR